MSEAALSDFPALRNQRKEGAAAVAERDDTRNELGAGLDDRERFCEVLDLYEQALQDLRIFARRKSFNKRVDDDQLCSRLEAKISSSAFLETLGSIYVAPAKILQENEVKNGSKADDQNSWHFINEKDLINSEFEDPCNSLKLESYVMVTQEDIIDGMACFMAKYVSSLPQLKDLSPIQLQIALKQVLGVSQKGRLTRLWSGRKYLYTAASWGATVVSLYNNPFVNPVVNQAASKTFWASIQLVMKFL